MQLFTDKSMAVKEGIKTVKSGGRKEHREIHSKRKTQKTKTKEKLLNRR